MIKSGTFKYSIPINHSALNNPIINLSNSFTFYADDFVTETVSPFYVYDSSNNIYKYNFKYTTISGNDGFSIWNSGNTGNSNITIVSFGGVPLSRNGLNFREYTGKFPPDASNAAPDARDDIPTLLSGTTLDGMFYYASNFNQNISTWDVSYCTNFGSMFIEAVSFNQNISNWNVSNATEMNNMFQNAKAFNQNISNWNVSNVYNASSMFKNAESFNQDISNWNISKFSGLTGMFQNAKAFNQPIGNWDIKSVGQMYNAFDGCALNIDNYSNLLINWASQAQQYDKRNVILGAFGLKYSSRAIAARNTLTNIYYNWGITGDSLSKDVPTIGPFIIPPKIYGDPPFQLNDPSSNSNGQFTYTCSNPLVATITGKIVTIVGVGTADITATQAETLFYTEGTKTGTLTVTKTTPTIGPFIIPPKQYGDLPFQLNDPISNSNGQFTYTSSETSVAIITGKIVTIVGVGTTVITAKQAETIFYSEGIKTATLTVTKGVPILGTFVVSSVTYGTSPFQLNAPSSSSDGTFNFISSNQLVATISGSTVTVGVPGNSTITAIQEATAFYTSASVSAQFTVNKIVPQLSGFTVPSVTYGASSFQLNAPLSPSKGLFTYTSSNQLVATISGSTVTVVLPGNSTITATQAETPFYTSVSVQAPFTVNKITTVLSDFSFAQRILKEGVEEFLINPPKTNRTTNKTTTYKSSNTSVASTVTTFSGPKIKVNNAGTANITATQAETTIYTEGIIISPIEIKLLSDFTILSAVFGDPPLTIIPPKTVSTGLISYTSSNLSVATVTGDTLTITGGGTTTITATQEASGKYPSESITTSFVVSIPVSSPEQLTNFLSSSSETPTATMTESVTTTGDMTTSSEKTVTSENPDTTITSTSPS
jgi:surface protein